MLTPIYMDNHLLALDKPGGLLSQPSGTDDDSLEQQGKDFLRETFNKPGNVFLEAVHRIDRPTFGVVLFARTSKALARLNDAMRKGRCQKTYRAILTARPPQECGTLQDWLAHDDFHAEVTRPNAPNAKLCTLRYRTLQVLKNGQALVEVDLQTGRYHQIRAQFANRGCPVLGDARYGAPKLRGQGRIIALQHYLLETPHPTQDVTLTMRSNVNLLEVFRSLEHQL